MTGAEGQIFLSESVSGVPSLPVLGLPKHSESPGCDRLLGGTAQRRREGPRAHHARRKLPDDPVLLAQFNALVDDLITALLAAGFSADET